MENFKLGSLFDGSGGFPLAGVLCGVTPLWASEIEKFPIQVTSRRFPNMKHLGDITKINGAEIEPVDIITFGSPCQDLSVAGKQKGLTGERSGLFMEAIRIIKEMRNATNGIYPRFIVWENVPGAFSSNGGEDFRTVLQEISSITDDTVFITEPTKGKWLAAGEILGDNFSLAWRTLNAQYWGVPQRRRRIFLVADFTGQCAPKILFERKGLSGNIEKGEKTGQGIANDAQGSINSAGFNGWRSTTGSLEYADDRAPCLQANMPSSVVINDQGGESLNVNFDGISPTLRAEAHGNLPCVVAGFRGRAGKKSGGIAYHENTAPTLIANQDAHVFDARGFSCRKTRSTITGDHESHISDYTTLCLQGNGIDWAETAGCNGKGWCEDIAYTLNTIDRHAVAYSASDINNYKAENVNVSGIDCRNSKENGDLCGTLQAKPNGGYSLNYTHPVRIGKTVRRLTPTECARLQGFPDWWCSDVPHKDTAEYKMWGNGITLPCAVFVLQGIVECLRKQLREEQT